MTLRTSRQTIIPVAVVILFATGCAIENGKLRPWWKSKKDNARIVSAGGELSGDGGLAPPMKSGLSPAESSALPAPMRVEPQGAVPELRTVYFDYDAAALNDEARRTLEDNIAWLQVQPNAVVQIEGHCDERGTAEYNAALGQRRADAVRFYLVGRGVDPQRLHTISYGEDRPVALGGSEEAWRLNRRARFLAYR